MSECNCRKKVNNKYTDHNEVVTKLNPLLRIAQFILQIGFGIICGAIIIVMMIPMLIYITISLMFGREINFRIKDFNKFLNKE